MSQQSQWRKRLAAITKVVRRKYAIGHNLSDGYWSSSDGREKMDYGEIRWLSERLRLPMPEVDTHGLDMEAVIRHFRQQFLRRWPGPKPWVWAPEWAERFGLCRFRRQPW